MKGWKKIKIEDLGKVMTGNTPPRKNPELYGSYTLFIKPTDVSLDTRYTLNPEECYSELGYKKYIKSLIPKGSTCVVTIGSIGKKITQAHCDCFINQAMNAVIPSDSYDKNFVYYLLKHNLHSVKAVDSGTASGRENVSKSSFSSIEVFVPNELETQILIGKDLSAYDELIQNNFQRLILLEEIAQKTYDEWFVRFKVESKKLKINTQTNLPFGWTRKKLGEFLPIITGKKDANFGTVDGKFPFFTCSQEPIKSPSFSFDAAAILLAGNGEFNVKLYRGKFEAYQRTYVLIPKEEKHLLFLFRTIKFYLSTLVAGSKGSVIKYLTKDMIENFEIVFPDDKILDEFNFISMSLQKLIENLEYQNRLLKEARDILLPRLMTGIIKV